LKKIRNVIFACRSDAGEVEDVVQVIKNNKMTSSNKIFQKCYMTKNDNAK
jgi:hypothetical protein